MNYSSAACAIVATFALSACAKSPESIAPAYQSSFIYDQLSCDQLAEEDQRVSSALIAASAQQEKARSNDIVGVIFIGLPVSSLSGDNIAPQIAQLKGQKEALHQQKLTKKCEV